MRSSTTRTRGLAAYGETALLESTNNGVYERYAYVCVCACISMHTRLLSSLPVRANLGRNHFWNVQPSCERFTIGRSSLDNNSGDWVEVYRYQHKSYENARTHFLWTTKIQIEAIFIPRKSENWLVLR